MKRKKIKNMLNFKKEEIVSVFEIDGDRIKLAQIEIANGKRILRRLSAVKAVSSKAEDVAKSITDLSNRFNLPQSLIFVELPRNMVTVRDIQLPSINQEELEGMISIQSSKMLPYAKEEIIYGYKLIETSAEGYSRIMVVLTHKDVVNKILNIFKLSGLDVNRIALSSEALSNWYLSRKPYPEPNTLITLIEIDSTTAEIQLIYNSAIEFTRSITFTPLDRASRLIDELNLSFAKHKKRLMPAAEKLVLTGADSIVNEAAPLLKREFNLPTVYIDPLKAWPQDKETRLPSDEQRKEFSFASVIALAFNFDKLELNFMPLDIQRNKTTQLMKEALFVTGLLTLCIILGISGMVWKKIDDKSRYVQYINAEIKKTGPEVEKLTKMMNNLNLIKAQLDMRGTSVDIIREIYKLIPANISLTILDFEENVTCTLRGTADELSNVFKFNTILEKSPYFRNVKVRYATKRVVKRQTLTDFEIVCSLKEGSEFNEAEE